MSRMVWIVALSKALGRPPTDQERTAYLSALAGEAGGEYVYVPKLPHAEVDAGRVWELRNGGLTIRQIAAELKCSTFPVYKILQQPLLFISPYEDDKQAA